jgi:hypothetical protein
MIMAEMTDEKEKEREECGKKTVLCVFKDRRRPVTFVQDKEPKRERQNLLEAVHVSFSDLLSCGEGPSSSSPTYFLQREHELFGLIDLTGYVEDLGTVHLCVSSQGGGSDVSVGMYYYSQGSPPFTVYQWGGGGCRGGGH